MERVAQLKRAEIFAALSARLRPGLSAFVSETAVFEP